MAAPTQQEFEQLLLTLMGTDNDARNKAEAALEQLKKNPAWLVPALLTIIQASEGVPVRHMGAVVLRRCMTTGKGGDKPPFFNLNEEQQTAVKQQLLQLLETQEQKTVRRALSFCVSALFSAAADEEGEQKEWNGLFPFILRNMQNGAPELKQSMLAIISQLAHKVSDAVLKPHLGTIKDAFAFTLEQNMPVRVAAIDAIGAIVTTLDDEDDALVFQPLLGTMIASIGMALTAGDNDSAASCIDTFINLAGSTPGFLTPAINDCFRAMLQIAQTNALPDNVRQLAVEWTLTFSEADPKTAKKVPEFVESLIHLALEFMLHPSEDSSWGETDEDEEELINYDVGVEALDRIANALKGKKVEPVAAKCIAQALESTDWKYKHAGLIALAQIAEGCDRQLEPNLGTVVQMVLKHLDDTHERVRWAAVHCLAQFCNDFQPGLQATLHSMVLPAFMRMLGDSVPRVHAHAATGIVNFVACAQFEHLEAYLDELLTKLLLVLQKSQKRFVHVQVLSAISSVAENAEEKFSKYYDHIVPYLKTVLKNTFGDKEGRMLRAKCMECLTLVMMSVGKEKFAADAGEVMEILHTTQSSKMDPDDPQSSYLLQAWGRLAKALGADFAPYLDHVIPPVLEQAGLTTDVSVEEVGDGGDDDDDGDNEEEGVQTIRLAIKGIGERKITIRTSMLEDKLLACNLVLSYLEDLKQHMGKFVERISEIMIPLLKFPYMEEIRDSAARTLPLLMTCVKDQPGDTNQFLAEMLQKYVTELLSAMQQEPCPSVVAALCESFSKCVVIGPKDCLGMDKVKNTAEIIKQVFEESLKRRKNVVEEKVNEDDEDEVEKLDEENEGEEELLNQAVECVGSLVKTHQCFLPEFSAHFYPLCRELLTTHASSAHGNVECRLALCVFDDFIEHGAQVNVQFVQPFVQEITQYLMTFITHTDPDLVQACAYGLGVLAQNIPDTFTMILPEAIQRLTAIVRSQNAQDDDNIYATANAISSLMKIFEKHASHASGQASQQNLLPVILQALPVKADEIEAQYVHERIVDLVAAGNPIVVGQNNANMKVIGEMFLKLIDTELVNDTTKGKMRQILQSLGVNPPGSP